MSGEVSIWSLACEYPLGHVNKGVTIELRNAAANLELHAADHVGFGRDGICLQGRRLGSGQGIGGAVLRIYKELQHERRYLRPSFHR